MDAALPAQSGSSGESGARARVDHQPSLTTSVLHDDVRLRLGRIEQRYTPARRALVEAMLSAGRPLSIPELLSLNPELPQSSAYRNVTALIEAGVVRRVAATDDHGRFELSEELAGHHHHLVCAQCGTVTDVVTSARLEQALAEAALVVREELGFEVDEHRFDLIGRCGTCRGAEARPA